VPFHTSNKIIKYKLNHIIYRGGFMVKLYFLGKDKRSEYLKKLYEKEVNIVGSIEQSEYVILPIPFTKDKVHITGEDILVEDLIKKCINKTIFSGAIAKEFKRQMEINNVTYVDLMELDEVALLNAIPTAEGAIVKAIEMTDITMHGTNVLVLGFGRVAKILADKLKGLNANVFCAARKQKDLAHINALGYNVVDINNMRDSIGKMDIIFNTVPTMILGEKKLGLLNKNTVIIDLASAPGGVDFKVAEDLGIKAYHELALPSKVAPKSAASYLKQSIDSVIYNK